MQIISIKLMKLKVNSFSPRTGELNLSLVYDDGARARDVTKNVLIKDNEQLAAEFMREIRNSQKKLNYIHDEEGLFAGHMNVIIDKEDGNTDKLAGFLRILREKAEKVAKYNKAEGYIKVLEDIKMLEFKF
jgi:hypothetical protein